MSDIDKYIEEFEKKEPYTAWINSDIYPDGRIYTKEFTQHLFKKNNELKKELHEAKQLLNEWSMKEQSDTLNETDIIDLIERTEKLLTK